MGGDWKVDAKFMGGEHIFGRSPPYFGEKWVFPPMGGSKLWGGAKSSPPIRRTHGGEIFCSPPFSETVGGESKSAPPHRYGGGMPAMTSVSLKFCVSKQLQALFEQAVLS